MPFGGLHPPQLVSRLTEPLLPVKTTHLVYPGSVDSLRIVSGCQACLPARLDDVVAPVPRTSLCAQPLDFVHVGLRAVKRGLRMGQRCRALGICGACFRQYCHRIRIVVNHSRRIRQHIA
jgi:hypothetical protein